LEPRLKASIEEGGVICDACRVITYNYSCWT